MPLIARQRSRLAVLAVLALVGSLLAVSAVPVAAEDDDRGESTRPLTRRVSAPRRQMPDSLTLPAISPQMPLIAWRTTESPWGRPQVSTRRTQPSPVCRWPRS